MDGQPSSQQRGLSRGLWPARHHTPSQQPAAGFGRPAAPLRQRLPQPGKGFGSRQGYQAAGAMPGGGFGSSQGRDCSPAGSRSFAVDSPARQQGLPGSQPASGWLPPRQLSLRERVQAAASPRYISPSHPAPLFPDSQQGDTMGNMYPSSLPFDSAQSQQELQMQSQMQDYPRQQQPSPRAPPAMPPLTQQDTYDPDLTQASSLPDPGAEQAAVHSRPPQADLACSQPSGSSAAVQDILQLVQQLSSTVSRLEGSLDAVSSNTAAQGQKLTGMQSSCALALKSIQVLLQKQKAACAPPVTHEQAVQTSGQPQASTAVQTSPLPTAPVASVAVQTSCAPGAPMASLAVQTSAAHPARLAHAAVQTIDPPARTSAAVQTGTTHRPGSQPQQQQPAQTTSLHESGQKVSAAEGLLMLGAPPAWAQTTAKPSSPQQIAINLPRKPLQPARQRPTQPAPAAGAGRWNLRARKAAPRLQEAYSGCTAAVCGELGTEPAEQENLAASTEARKSGKEPGANKSSKAPKPAEKRKHVYPEEQTAAQLLEGPDVTALAPGSNADVLKELDDEIARKIQRRLQRHRDKHQKKQL